SAHLGVYRRAGTTDLRSQEAIDTLEDLLNMLGRESADFVQQIPLVHGEKLRDHDDAPLRQACFALIEKDIARNSSPAEIGCQGADYDGIDSALIEGIVLHHHAGTDETRARPRG